MNSNGKDREKDIGFEFYIDYVFVTHKVTIFTAQASKKPQNLTVDLSADDGTLLVRLCKSIY